jgi:hypothetical protein
MISLVKLDSFPEAGEVKKMQLTRLVTLGFTGILAFVACRDSKRDEPVTPGTVTEPEILNSAVIFPEDFSTNTGQDLALRVLVRRGDAPVDPELLAKVAGGIELRTWPEWERVPSTAKLVKEGDETPLMYPGGLLPMFQGTRKPRQIDIVPSSKLEDRWYAVSTGDFDLHQDPLGRTMLKGRAVISRFRTGPEARVASLSLFEKTEKKKLTLSVTMTEDVKLGMPDEQGDAVSLGLADGGAPQKCKVEVAPRQPTKDLLVVCEGTFGRPEKATLVLTQKLTDTAERAISETFTLEPAKATDCGAGCQLFRP